MFIQKKTLLRSGSSVFCFKVGEVMKNVGKKPKSELTEKQKLFCLYYVKNFNATQAYLKAYGCSYNTAHVEAFRHLANPSIRKEIQRLKKEKEKTIMVGKSDIVERFMRIAFADMTDFVEFYQEEVPVMGAFGPVTVKNEKTGQLETMTRIVNAVRFKKSSEVDGGLICQVKQGRDGASIKLEDRQKALEWLASYFEMNPMDKHRKEFDNKKLALDAQWFDLKKEAVGKGEENPDDGFIEAMQGMVKEVWDDEDEAHTV